ncbi:unnamed protein product [Meganyctiphanes norvegica]|uniref:Cytokine-inducible SH2-containing protein n=1 Tax=Meganyctiphanes norvegica TaxID=48144 RepID=A0AAV2PLI8_MEGNR
MLVCPSCHTGVAMPFVMPSTPQAALMTTCPWSQKTLPRPPQPPYICGNIFHTSVESSSSALVPVPGVPCHVLYCLSCAQACTHLYPGLQHQQQQQALHHTTTTCTHQYPTHMRCLAQHTGVTCPKTVSCSHENRPSLHKSGGVCTEGSGEGSGDRRRSITPEAVVSLPPNTPVVSGCSLLQPPSLFRPDSVTDISLKFSSVKENTLNNLNNMWTEAKDRQCLAVCQSQLEESGWYYGPLSWQKAAEMLKDTAVGTFLVRDSASPNCRYSLSVQTANGPTSVRIHYSKGKFRLDCAGHSTRTSPDSSSVVQLMETYVNEYSKLVWVDHEGKAFSPINIRKPLRRGVPSLQHLCRLAVNSSPNNTSTDASCLPQALKSFLSNYPNTC